MELPEVRAFAERGFASCSCEGERRVMQRKLHAIVSGALMNGRVREIDWGSEPTPPLDPQEVAWEIARKGLGDACRGFIFENEDPVDVARRALDLGVPIDEALDDRGSLSPLVLAVECREIAVANFLLDRGAKATSEALIRACVMTSVECPLELVERLLKAGADPGEGGSPYIAGDKLTPLYYAVDELGRGNVPLARLLLDHGAPVDVGNVDGDLGGQTPLYKACQFGEVAMTRLLLARGAGWDKVTYSDPKCAEWATPLLAVRLNRMASPVEIQLNDLFDDFLAHYWRLRQKLRLFGRRENHAAGPQRVVLGDAFLPNKIGAFVVGDGILVKKKK